MDTWEMVDADRAEFADLADSLTPAQWDTQSLCTAWKVRDVVAHVTQGATIGTGESVKKMFKYGFRLNKLLTEEAQKAGAASTDDLRADLRATIGSRVRQPGVKPSGVLTEDVIHQQDVRRAIGVPRQIPADRLRVVLDDVSHYNNMLLPTKKRLKGLRLKATDLDWEGGDAAGAEVGGPGEALMMAMAGRAAALADLSGAGTDQLRARDLGMSAAFERDEVEREFQRYVERGKVNDWSAWADQFTEDALYVEHEMGTFRGREQIREWITTTMASVSGMSFPVEWYVIDGDRVVMYCWNVFEPLAGMTGEYRFAVVTILIYAGDGRWSYEEDVYNGKEAEEVLARFLTDAAAAGHSPPGGA